MCTSKAFPLFNNVKGLSFHFKVQAFLISSLSLIFESYKTGGCSIYESRSQPALIIFERTTATVGSHVASYKGCNKEGIYPIYIPLMCE